MAPLHRILQRDLPIADELDWLCGMVEDLARPDRTGDASHFVRLAVAAAAGAGGGGGGAMLAMESTRRVFDGEGHLREVHVSPASRYAPLALRRFTQILQVMCSK